MDYDEEVRHRKFEAEKKLRQQKLACKRLAIISILLIIIGILTILGGCETYHKYQTQDEDRCHYKVSSKQVNVICPFY